MKRILCTFPFIGAILFAGCGSDNIVIGGNEGGTITETVGIVGTLTDPAGTVLPHVTVNLIADGAVVKSTQSDQYGVYIIDSLQQTDYRIEAYNADSSLTLLIPSVSADSLYYTYNTDSLVLIIIDDDTIPAYALHVSKLYPPGYISGTVMTYENNLAGALAYIPGTSYGAWTDAAGSFTISKIPPGTFVVYYQLDGYVTAADSPVVVTSGTITALAPKQLERDPSSPPPAPRGITVSYDTLTGTVTLSWEAVELSDLAGYTVYRDTGGGASPAATVIDTSYLDTVFVNMLDTRTRTLTYQVTTLDTLGNQSQLSQTAVVTAASPTMVRTFFEFELDTAGSDSITTDDTLSIICMLVNETRSHQHIRWYSDDDTIPERFVYLSAGAIQDTYIYIPEDTGIVVIRVAALDNAGMLWCDTIELHVSPGAAPVIRPVNTWESCAPLPTARKYLGAAAIGGKIYAAGGRIDAMVSGRVTPAALTTVEVYDTATQAWSSVTPLDSGRAECAVVAAGGKLYVIGGTNYRHDFLSVKVYDPSLDSWSDGPPLPSIRIGAAACVLDNTIYLFGGITDNWDLYPAVDLYNTAKEGPWATRAAAITPRAYHQTVAVQGMIYVIGGIAGTTCFNATAAASVDAYAPSTNAVTAGLPMNTARVFFGATSLNNRLIAAGGSATTTISELLKNVDSFDYLSGAWTSKAALNTARHGFAACAFDNCMWIFGGSEQVFPQLGETNAVERYYP